jgi:serine phosphatase RsbU (regulator of sigma subunit)
MLWAMNRALAGRFEAQFVTAAYVSIDTSRGLLRYSLAGHPHPLLRTGASGRLVPLTAAGLMLGVLPDQTYPVGECRFDPGDRLILFTDGVTDVDRPSGEWFGEGELRAFSDAHPSGSADEFATALTAHLERWSGRSLESHTFDDDLTLLVVDARNVDARRDA